MTKHTKIIIIKYKLDILLVIYWENNKILIIYIDDFVLYFVEYAM